MRSTTPARPHTIDSVLGPVENVFFDLDGTLVDSLPGIEFAVRAAFAETGLPATSQDVSALLGPPIRVILSQLCAECSPANIDELEFAFRRAYDADGWRLTDCYPGVREAISGLRALGIRLFLVTNKPCLATVRILESLGMADQFQQVLTPDSHRPSFTSKAAMLRHLLLTWRLSAQTCLMVGDTLEDWQAAATVRMPAVAVAYGYSRELPVGLPRLARVIDLVSLCRGAEQI